MVCNLALVEEKRNLIFELVDPIRHYPNKSHNNRYSSQYSTCDVGQVEASLEDRFI